MGGMCDCVKLESAVAMQGNRTQHGRVLGCFGVRKLRNDEV